jgi:hypothetical protein
MTPQQRRGSNRQTAASAPAAEAVLTVESVTPAPRTTRKGSIAFPEATVQALADAIQSGWAGDGQLHDSRQKAGSRVTRLKRALIHYGHYSDPKQIKSRVWPDGDGFRLGLIDAAKASD